MLNTFKNKNNIGNIKVRKVVPLGKKRDVTGKGQGARWEVGFQDTGDVKLFKLGSGGHLCSQKHSF